MCYHYSVSRRKDIIEKRFSAIMPDDFLPVFHADGFTHRPLPVITAEEPGLVQMYHWGLIPFFIKTKDDAKKISIQTLNAMGETVFEKPSFRSYIGKKRCLVLADGFFEWMHVGKNKYPHYIYLKSGEPFAFAGMYTTWVDKATGEVINNFNIITTAANPLMEKIHNTKKRMPVILQPDRERLWLKPDLMKDEIINLIQPLDDELMAAHTVSKLITSRMESSNQEDVTKPFEYPELIAG